MTGADLLYLMAAPFFAPPFLYKMLVRGKYRLSSRGMLGLDLKGEPWGSRDAVAPRLWLHAVSVGEVVAGKAILAEWARFRPDTRIVASTVTETGQQKARDLLTEADEFTFFPLDLTPVVTRFLNWYDPQVYVMMETEIWPNFLRQAARRGTKVFLANGKLSDSSFRRWERFHKLLQGTFDAITAAAVQTEQDREKFVRLLGRPDDVLVTGNCKFDSSGTPITPAEHAGFLDRLRIPTDAPVIVAGSTHPGEEEIVLNAWTAVRGRIPDCRLILAPRHPERFDAVARLLRERGIRFSRFTSPDASNPEAVLVDTIGVLARLYGLGRVAVMCGTFVPIGGHNLLEAAVHGIPVVYGPHMHKQPELMRLFGPTEGGIQIQAAELSAVLERLLTDEGERSRRGAAALKAASLSRGSARRTVEFFKKYLERA